MPHMRHRPGRRWLFVLALGAVLPFTLVACGDDNGKSTGDQIKESATNAKETVSAAAENAQSAVAGIRPLTVDLKEVGDSSVSGNAVITPEGTDRSRASFKLDVGQEKGQLTAGIWKGSCGSLSGSPEVDLGNVGDNVSTQAFDKGISDLNDGGYALAIRAGTTVVACGGVG